MTNKTSIMIIQKKSLADMIAETLKQQITEGTYRAGDKLPTEPELMKTFGVGRSSVREAVKLLVNMGVVRVQQGSGTFVAVPSNNDDVNIKMSTADRTELDEVRKILDIAIVEKAVARRTEKDIEHALNSAADYILLDQGGGGTGKPFDWSLIHGIERPFFLAGGLSGENLESAIHKIHPYAVDLSSGVETDMWKDPVKIKNAVEIVRRT